MTKSRDLSRVKYKKQLLLSAGLGVLLTLNAQEVVTAAGGFETSGILTVSWSIGEVMTETFTQHPFTLTQGVQQPTIEVESAISSPEMNDYKISVYPNPASDAVIVSIAETAELPLTLKLFDMNGNLLYATQITSSETRIPVANFAQGIYLLHVADKKNNSQTFKIIKN
jgi:hypothetical protein